MLINFFLSLSRGSDYTYVMSKYPDSKSWYTGWIINIAIGTYVWSRCVMKILPLQEIRKYRWKGNSSNYNNGINQNSVELTSLVKMALIMQQQITVAAWAITYANDREAARRARREFNVAMQPSTVGKWRKGQLETGRMQKVKRGTGCPFNGASSSHPPVLQMIIQNFPHRNCIVRRRTILLE